MSYDNIDTIIIPWAAKNKLKLYTLDREWEIRSFHIDDEVKRGRNYKIWIDLPDEEGVILIHIMNRNDPKNRTQLSSKLENLERDLNSALSIALICHRE